MFLLLLLQPPLQNFFFSFPPADSIVFSDQQTSSSLNGLLYIQKTVEIQLDHTQNWGRTSVFYLLKMYSVLKTESICRRLKCALRHQPVPEFMSELDSFF